MSKIIDKLESRDDCVRFAKLAEQVEQYEDMVKAMKKAVLLLSQSEGEKSLTPEERNLLSVAYKNVVGARRSSWRIISSVLHKAEKDQKDEKQIGICTKYKEKIEEELINTCNEVIELVEKNILQPDSEKAGAEDDEVAVEAKVFFKKMLGDYCRYTVEVKQGDDRQENTVKAARYYDCAYETSKKKIAPTNPIRLGLALNYSVFYYEIKNDPSKACSLAKEAFDEAIKDLESLPEESYKDSTLIMQLLRDNLTLWTSDNGDNEGQDDDDE